jgi:hypothetical protein
VTRELHALKNNPIQLPLEAIIEVVFIPLVVHSTLSGKGQLSLKWWMSGIEKCL